MSRPQTPPHEPRYNVHVAPTTISQLIRTAFPNIELVSSFELTSHKGYNNRLYLLTVRRRGGPSCVFRDTNAAERELVLKANGRFFLADKVQNEVGCLQVLGQYCPAIPTPVVFAWSEEGHDVCLASPAGSETKNVALAIPDGEKQHGGWILMSRLPGAPLSVCDLDEVSRLDIMRQLAGVTASWRTDIPAQMFIGNVQFHQPVHASEPDFVIVKNSGPRPQNLVVRGMLVDELRITTPITSVTEQYTRKLEQKLTLLETSDTYRPNRHLAPGSDASSPRRFRD